MDWPTALRMTMSADSARRCIPRRRRRPRSPWVGSSPARPCVARERGPQQKSPGLATRASFIRRAHDGRAAKDQVGTLRSISLPISPAAISRRAVTPCLFLDSILGVWPWLSMRARYVAASTSWKRFGIFSRQSSTVMRAIRYFLGWGREQRVDKRWRWISNSRIGATPEESGQVQRGEDVGVVGALGREAQGFGLLANHRAEFRQGLVEITIYYNKVEALGLGDLVAGIRQALGDDLRQVLAAAAQALRQLVPARRQDEDQHRGREELADLQCALPVDLQHDVLAVGQQRLDALARRAVPVAVHMRVLEALAGRDHLLEALDGGEVVFAAVALLLARRARGVRHRDGQVRLVLEQRLDEGRFAGTAGGGDDEELAGEFHGKSGEVGMR